MYDLIVLGGGPGGYETAKLAGMKGLKTVLIEEHDLGGTCLNRGCIPLKTFLHFARIKDEYESAVGSGLVTGDIAQLDQKKIKSYKEFVVKALRRGVQGMEKAAGVTVVSGRGIIKLCEDHHIVVSVSNEEYEAKNLVIATGSEENKLFFRSVDLPYKVIYSDGFLELEDVPKRVVIVGGGVIGIECASYLQSAGCEVTILEAQGHIGGGLDDDVAASLERILKKKGIRIFTDSLVERFEVDGVHVNSGIIPADCVLISIGRCARITDIKNTAIHTDGGYIAIDKFCMTNIGGVYACGDVTGKLLLAHVAYAQARVIVDHLMGRVHDGMEYNLIPQIIYSNPEVLTVGYTELDCKEKGIEYEVKVLPMTYNGKYFAEHGKDGTVAKIVVSDGKLCGFSMIGNGAAEIGVAVGMMIGRKIDDLKKIVFPHPTVGEIVHELCGVF